MAKDGPGGEKTEKPTSKRRQDTREKGTVLKSTEVITAAGLFAMFIALKALSGYYSSQGMQLVTFYFSGTAMPEDGVLHINDITNIMLVASAWLFKLIAPLLIVAVVIGIISHVAQYGLLFSVKALTPNFGRLNPLKGIANLFSIRKVVDLLKSIVKFAIIAIVLLGDLQNFFQRLAMLVTMNFASAIPVIFDMIFSLAFKLCTCFAILAPFDYLFQRHMHVKDMMMTKYEVKMEYKQQEGDPQVKAKIKHKQRQMSMMRMMDAVPQADVIITNPTHFAVALKYEADDNGAPVVVAKGQDLIAQKIKQVGKDAGVEIVEDKPLARALFSNCEIGMQIPPELFGAVAEVLAYVYKIKNKLGDKK